MKALLAVVAFCVCGAVHADVLQDRFETVWESLWYQGGAPTMVIRWEGEIRVRIHGRNKGTHQDRVMSALGKVTSLAGVQLVDVSDTPDAAKTANLDVEVVSNEDLQDNQACFVRIREVANWRIKKVELKMRDRAVYRCVLHEAMHAMGISGHPTGSTVLSYFYQRVDTLTELDTLMLRAWYSPRMRPGMTPLDAVVVLTDAVVAAQVDNWPQARAAQSRFLQGVLRDMEAFGSDQGDVPGILKRSGTASGNAINEGRKLMQFYLGVAYADGTIASKDMATGLSWLERAARGGLLYAQLALGFMYENGKGVDADAMQAYAWFGMAAAQEVPGAVQALQRLASVLTPDQVAQAKARIPARP